MRVRCPKCSMLLSASEEHLGCRVTCPGCGGVFAIAAPKATSAAAPAAAPAPSAPVEEREAAGAGSRPAFGPRRRLLVAVTGFVLLFLVGFLCKSSHSSSERMVDLSVCEPCGVDRVAEPVTSGVPLPKGVVFNSSELSLAEKKSGRRVPCQFTVLSRWPDGGGNEKDGSIKWVLLDFFADVKRSETVEYTLARGNKSDGGARMRSLGRRTAVEAREDQDTVCLDTGRLLLKFSRSRGVFIEEASVDGKKVISGTSPCEAVLKLGDGRVYRTSLGKPDLVAIEDRGPLRARVRVKGKFLDDKLQPLIGGKATYDLRVTAYAGKPYARFNFTFENGGSYTGQNRQWLYIRSLALHFPIAGTDKKPGWFFGCGTGALPVGDEPVSFVQWLKYPKANDFGWHNAGSALTDERERAAGMADEWQGFYHILRKGDWMDARKGKASGWAEMGREKKPALRVSVRRFWQNFPRGFEALPGTLSVLFWPEGDFWPRTKEMAEQGVYQFEGLRFKTLEMLVQFDPGAGAPEPEVQALDQPLFARAPAEWYAKTEAIWPLAPVGSRSGDAGMDEALERYDRLQLAKVHQNLGDPAGPMKVREGLVLTDWYGRVSIPSLREKCPDIFYGAMNFGDLVWAHGYCSLFYDWTYGMMVQHLRTNDRVMFDIADDMAHHRYDIDRGSGFQHYEKGFHGHAERIDRRKYRDRGFLPKPSHCWNRGLLLHWVLTGDPRSREAAEENGKAYFGMLDPHKDKQEISIPEFRIPGWAMEACLAMYEYTGQKQYLAKAGDIFARTLLAMERGNGSRGHIIKNGEQSAQFTSYILEPVARLHHLTGDREVIGFLKRVLDWEREKGTIDGVMVKGGYRPLMFIEDWRTASVDPDYAFGSSMSYGLMFADAYAYAGGVLGAQDDLAYSRRLFREFMFYYGLMQDEFPPEERTPLGFHFRGEIADAAAKVHAYTSKYGQIAMMAANGSMPAAENVGSKQREETLASGDSGKISWASLSSSVQRKEGKSHDEDEE